MSRRSAREPSIMLSIIAPYPAVVDPSRSETPDRFPVLVVSLGITCG
jgi:hypothetical protein